MSKAPPASQGESDRWIAAGLAAFLVLLYWSLRCRTFGPGDSPQHVLSSITWGVSRPPGYPLYVMLGHLFSLLPLGPAAGNVNGMSGVFAALSVAALFLLLRRAGCARPAALTACGLMAFAPLFWFYAEVAEVRSLNNLLALAAAYWAAAWRQERRPYALPLLGIALGLGISHHPTYAALLPAFLFLAFSRERPRGPSELAWLLLPGLAALAAPYLILGLRLSRPAAYNPDEVSTWKSVLELFLRKGTGGYFKLFPGEGLLGFTGFDWEPFVRHLRWFLDSALREPTPAGFFLALLGAWSLRRQRSPWLWFWTLWGLAAAGPYLLLSSQTLLVPDEGYAGAVARRFHLLPLIPLFALAGAGAHWVGERAPRPAWAWALAGAAALPLLLRPVNLKGHDLTRESALDILESSAPSDMLILAADDTISAMLYLDLVERRTGDRVFLEPLRFSYPPYIRRLKRRHPGLRLPLGPQGLSPDWRKWLELNPGRELYAEATLAGAILPSWPQSAPSGVLIQLARKPVPRPELERRARAFLASGSLARLVSRPIHTLTQEVYLLRAAAAQASWCRDLLAGRARFTFPSQ